MASIDQPRKGHKYRLRAMYNGKQITVGHFTRLTDAKAVKARVEREIELGVFVPPKVRRQQQREREEREALRARPTGEVFDLFIKHLEAQGLKHSTVYTHKKRWDANIKSAFGDVPIVDITPAAVDRWYAGLVDKKGRNASVGPYSTLSQFFNYATGTRRDLPRHFEPFVDHSPVDIPGAGKAGRNKEPVTEYTWEQVQFLAAHMPDYLSLSVLLGAACGPRTGEVLALTRRDIEVRTIEGHETRWLNIDKQVQSLNGGGSYLDSPKTFAGYRKMILPPHMWELIDDHLDKFVGEGQHALLFKYPDRRDSASNPPWYPRTTFNNHWARAVEAWQEQHPNDQMVGSKRFYDLRHVFNTWYEQSGGTNAELMALSGHTDPAVAARYRHPQERNMARVARRISERVEAGEL